MTAHDAALLQNTASLNRRAATEMFFAAFAFSVMNCVAHGLGGVLPWPVIACGRIALTLVFALAVLWRLGRKPIVVGTPALWCRSLAGSCGLLFTFYSLTHLSITEASAIIATNPLWLVVILAVVFREPIHARTWFCMALALFGVWLIKRPSFSLDALAGDSFPVFVALAGAFVIAVAKVALSRCGDLPATAVVAHYAACATIVSAALAFALGGWTQSGPALAASAWVGLAAMGVAGTFGQYFMTRAYGRGYAPMVALIGLVHIVFGAAYDVFIWGHAFDRWTAIGITTIVAAVAFSVTANAGRAKA